jgi:8-oxo-dGTP pyrophosphatase MutT (NUDIX family)
VFNHCPLLRCDPTEVEKHLENFLHYKQRVNVYGAIILNTTLDKVLLVKGWYSRSSWGFPRGKINKDEPEISCAIREVYEEIGYDLTGMIDPKEFIELKIREQNIKLFIVHGVPETTNFAPQTRKEISKIEWHLVNDIGRTTNGKKSVNRYWTIMPFIRLLKKWIAVKQKEKRRRATGKRVPNAMSSPIMQSPKNFYNYKVPELKIPVRQLFLEPAPVKQENVTLEPQLNMKTGGPKRTSMRNFSFNKDAILSTFRQKVTTSV